MINKDKCRHRKYLKILFHLRFIWVLNYGEWINIHEEFRGTFIKIDGLFNQKTWSWCCIYARLNARVAWLAWLKDTEWKLNSLKYKKK